MRFLFFALSIIAISSGFSKEEDFDDMISYHPYYVPQAKKYSQGHLIENSQVMPGYNAPARIETGKSYDFFASGSYLFYQPIEKGLVFAYTSDDPQSNIGKFFEVHSNYKSGFKLALGFGSSSDDWVYTAEYTRLHFSKVKRVEQSSINTWINFTTTRDVMSNIRVKWATDLDMLDLTFARPFYSGTFLLLTPLFGLKGGYLDQSFNTDSTRLSDSASLYSRDRINSHFIGLIGGLKAKLLIFWGVNFFTDVKASLFYQQFKVRNRQNSEANPDVLFDNSINRISYLTPNLLISSGLEWGTYLSKNSYHISFLLGYEANVFFQQNLMAELKESRITTHTSDIGDLFFHGIIANFKFNF